MFLPVALHLRPLSTVRLVRRASVNLAIAWSAMLRLLWRNMPIVPALPNPDSTPRAFHCTEVEQLTKKYSQWEACVPCQEGRYKGVFGNQDALSCKAVRECERFT